MKCIAVINQKGGVGKTTTTVNLGAALASLGRRVLLIDLDPQAHLTMHFGHEVQQGDPTVYEVLTDRTPIGKTVRSVRDRVALVPAHTDLAGAEIELVNTVGREVILREALEPVGDDHDVMMIDCPPSLSLLTINALAAVDEVLIPLQTHFLGLQGLGKLLETIRTKRAFYPSFNMAATTAAIRSTPVEDLYVVPSENLPDGSVGFRIMVNPLIWWMWVAGPVMMVGTVVALWPQKIRAPAPVPSQRRLARGTRPSAA